MEVASLFPEIQNCHPSQFEKKFYSKGYRYIAGTDEVGRGCLAGPVMAAAVILPRDHKIRGIKDSKLLSPLQREKLFDEISASALSVAVGRVDSLEIDEVNIFQASLKAMYLAVRQLSIQPDLLLLDGTHPIPLFLPQKPIIQGDRHCKSIGAASIIAKVTRDRMMKSFEETYPRYSFSIHKGYPTPQHRREIKKYGPCPIHRMSFRLLEED